MSRTLPAAFRSILSGSGDASLVPLVEIALPGGTIYRAGHTHDVSFGGTTYVADNIDFGIIEATDEDKSPELEFAIQNVRDPDDDDSIVPWSVLTRSTDINGSGVTIMGVSLDVLNDTDAQVPSALWKVSGWECDTVHMHLRLAGPFDSILLEMLGPSIVDRVEIYDDGALVPGVTTYPLNARSGQ